MEMWSVPGFHPTEIRGGFPATQSWLPIGHHTLPTIPKGSRRRQVFFFSGSFGPVNMMCLSSALVRLKPDIARTVGFTPAKRG